MEVLKMAVFTLVFMVVAFGILFGTMKYFD